MAYKISASFTSSFIVTLITVLLLYPFCCSFSALQGCKILPFSISFFPVISFHVSLHLFNFVYPPYSRPSLLSFPFFFLFILSYFFFPFSHFVPARFSPFISLFDHIHFHLFLFSSVPSYLSFNSTFLSYYLLPPFV